MISESVPKTTGRHQSRKTHDKYFSIFKKKFVVSFSTAGVTQGQNIILRSCSIFIIKIESNSFVGNQFDFEISSLVMALFSTLVSRRLVSFNSGKNNLVTKTKQVALFRALTISSKLLLSSNNSNQLKYSTTKVLQRSFTTQNYDPLPKNDFFLRQV